MLMAGKRYKFSFVNTMYLPMHQFNFVISINDNNNKSRYNCEFGAGLTPSGLPLALSGIHLIIPAGVAYESYIAAIG